MEDALLLKPTDNTHHYLGYIPKEWSQGRACFGGVLLALSARAGALFASDDRRLRCINMTFVAPVGPGEVRVEIEPLRAGGSVTHLLCKVVQNENVVNTSTLAYGTGRPGSLEIPAIAMPQDAGEPGEGHAMPYAPPITPEFTQHIDYRWVRDSLPFSAGTQARAYGWVRPAVPTTIDEAQILAMMDAYPPPLWSLAKTKFMASSLSSHFQIRHIPDGEKNPHPWFLYDGPASVVGGGYSDAQARLWHENGTLVAVGMQQFADFSSRIKNT